MYLASTCSFLSSLIFLPSHARNCDTALEAGFPVSVLAGPAFLSPACHEAGQRQFWGVSGLFLRGSDGVPVRVTGYQTSQSAKRCHPLDCVSHGNETQPRRIETSAHGIEILAHGVKHKPMRSKHMPIGFKNITHRIETSAHGLET